MKGGNGRCRRHNGNAARGPAHPNYKTGRWSKYAGVLPEALVGRIIDTTPIEEIASTREEIMLLDARVAQVLDKERRMDPVRIAREAHKALADLDAALVAEDDQKRETALAELRAHLDQTAASAANWDEIRRTLETRDKLSKTEISYQKLLSDKILVEQIDLFVRALISEARALSDDRQKLTAYIMRVLSAGRLAISPALARALEASNDTIDAEFVTEDAK